MLPARWRACSTPQPGGSHQPLDRQTRYYADAARKASSHSCYLPDLRSPGNRTNERGRRASAESAIRSDGAFCPALVTGLPRVVVRWSNPPSLLRTARPVLPFLGAARWRFLCRSLRSLGWPELGSSSRYITGALNIAISMPFPMSFVFSGFRERYCRILTNSESVAGRQYRKP